MMLYPGLVLNNRYQIQRPIGRGGFSIVWLAVDMNDARSVAVKISLPEKDPAGEMPLRFEREFQGTRHFQHPNLLCPTDHFTHEESGCLVFDYMVNGTLHDRVKMHGTLSETEVAKVMNQIGGSLDYLHHNHFIHFDVKPENILINAQGDYFLSDFDTASRLENAMVRVSRIYADTPQYRSPEHLRGASELSEKVDIFALGITLFELCEGILEKEFGVGMMMLSGAEKPRFEANPELYTGRLLQIIHACWNHNPADRPTGEALSEYAHCLLENGYWPNIIEYRPDDIAFADAPSASVPGTARVTISLLDPNHGMSTETDKPTVLISGNDYHYLEQDHEGTIELPPAQPQYAQPDAWVPPAVHEMENTVIEIQEQDSAPLSGLENTLIENQSVTPPLSFDEGAVGTTVDPKPWTPGQNPESTLLYSPKKDQTNNRMKAVIIGVAALLIVAGYFLYLNVQKSRFNKFVASAQQGLKENKFKPAYAAIKTAEEMQGDSPEIMAIRRAILDASLTQHRDHLAKVRSYIASNNEDNYNIARQLLLDNSDNASILIADDSTSFYLDLIPKSSGITPPPDVTPSSNITQQDIPKTIKNPTHDPIDKPIKTNPIPTDPTIPKVVTPTPEQIAAQQRLAKERADREASLAAAEAARKQREAEEKAKRDNMDKEEKERMERDAIARKKELEDLKAQQAKAAAAAADAKRRKDEQDAATAAAAAKLLYKRTGTPVGLAPAARNTVPATNRKTAAQMTATLIPAQNIRLDKVYLAVDNCGVVETTLSGPKGTETDRTPVSPDGLAEIDFSDLGNRLEAGKTYTLTFSTSTGGGCKLTEKPKIEYLPGAETRNSAQLSLKQSGGAFLYDLKYKY